MKILIYTANEGKYKQIASLAAAMNIELQRIRESEFNTPLYALLGLPAAAASAPVQNAAVPLLYNPPEVMLLHAFPQGVLNHFLNTYRAIGIESLPFKAVTTPHNIGWTPYTLAEHLREEHEAMKRQ